MYLGIPKAGKVKRKEGTENNVKVEEIFFWCNLRLQFFHISEKEVFHFDSPQKVQHFYALTGTIHHVIVSGDLLVSY